MNAVQQELIEIIGSLSDQKLSEANSYLRYLAEKDEWQATQELTNIEILNEIKKGIDELKSGNYIRFEDIKRNV